MARFARLAALLYINGFHIGDRTPTNANRSQFHLEIPEYRNALHIVEGNNIPAQFNQ
jgi:hypothetical protein